MRIRDLLRLTLLFAALTIVALLSLVCEREEVADLPQDIAIRDAMAELASSRTQVEAEAAIRSLITKTEMGSTFPGSRYEWYTFSDQDIADLAGLQLLYASGKLQPTLGYNFQAMMNVAGEIYMPKLEFDSAASILQGEVDLALSKPEEPGNALVLAIASEGGNLPKEAPKYDENTVRSPVQLALFTVWLHREFARIPAAEETRLAPGDKDGSKGHCSAKCVIKYENTILVCQEKWASKPEKLKECISMAEEHLSECLEDCHDQGGSK